MNKLQITTDTYVFYFNNNNDNSDYITGTPEEYIQSQINNNMRIIKSITNSNLVYQTFTYNDFNNNDNNYTILIIVVIIIFIIFLLCVYQYKFKNTLKIKELKFKSIELK